jgi:hypothetical protein
MKSQAVTALAPIEAAVQRASQATGVDFDFLMKTAKRESGYNPFAKAGSSSAAGLFQFVGQTWLQTLKRHGAAHGYARYADLITQGSDGRLHVNGEEARAAVMNLRYDANASASMAGALANDHAAYLRGRVGREPTGGELYAAHFLGPEGAAKLVQAYEATPNVSAAALFPDAAQSNPGVFYSNGQPRSVAQLYANLSATGGTEVAVGTPTQAVELDNGQDAFMRYAQAGRSERARQEALLVDLILGDSGGRSAPGSLLTSEMLKVLASTHEGG